jgi:hypothetical protein
VTRNRFFSLCIFVLVGAFAGSYVATRAIPVVHAQVLGPQEIRATGFTLVNAQGKAQATLRSGVTGAELILNDTNGNPRTEVDATRGFVVRNAAGRILWESPRGAGILPAGGVPSSE